MPVATKARCPFYVPMHRQNDWDRVFAAVLCQRDRSETSDVCSSSTIGKPLYLAESESSYLLAASNNNPVMWENFGWLLDDMAETLETVISKPILFDPRLALPGFHIFASSARRPYSGGVWHVDIFNYEVLPQPLSAYSATLLLGDKINYYGVDYYIDDDIRSFEHKIGTITLFESSIRHRIAASRPNGADQLRVTLQAHVWVYPQQAIAFW